MAHWDDRLDMFRTFAEADLEAGDEVYATVVGYHGVEPAAVVMVRDFLKGEHLPALSEALSLPWGLGCTRLCVALPGRAWSLDDPIPPVVGDADLRQRVVAVDEVVAEHGSLRRTSVLLPFRRDGGAVVWDEPVALPASQGPVGDMLEVLAANPCVGGPTGEQVVECIMSLERKGHAVRIVVPQP